MHVVGLGGLHPSPPRRIAKDGLRAIGVHMDLEDVARHRDAMIDERASLDDALAATMVAFGPAALSAID